VPDGQYLLNDVSIKSDNKKIDVSSLEDYVRQKPNSNFLFFGKARLWFYSNAGDTSHWLNRFIQRKLGQPPVIYSARLAETSANQIRKELFNQGYLDAEVDTIQKEDEKKKNLTYNITSHTPYTVRNYEYRIDNKDIARPLSYMKQFTEIKPGILFDQQILEEERVKMNSLLRNIGYYTFSRDNLYYQADTTLNSHQVDLYLALRQTPDSTDFRRYRFRNVTILSGYDVASDDNAENFENPDTTFTQGMAIVHGKNNFLRRSMIMRNNYIRPGRFYSDMAVSRTYTAFNSTGAVRQTNVELFPVTEDSVDFVDARITISPGNVHWFQAGIDGTNSEGDIGIAPHVSYQHQNFFNGAEVLSNKL